MARLPTRLVPLLTLSRGPSRGPYYRPCHLVRAARRWKSTAASHSSRCRSVNNGPSESSSTRNRSATRLLPERPYGLPADAVERGDRPRRRRPVLRVLHRQRAAGGGALATKIMGNQKVMTPMATTITCGTTRPINGSHFLRPLKPPMSCCRSNSSATPKPVSPSRV